MRKFVWRIENDKIKKVNKNPNGSFKEWTHCKKDLEEILSLRTKLKTQKKYYQNLLKNKLRLINYYKNLCKKKEIEVTYLKNRLQDTITDKTSPANPPEKKPVKPQAQNSKKK